MILLLLIACGGGIGAVLRYCVIRLVTKYHRPSLIATVIVNSIGSFFSGWAVHHTLDEPIFSAIFITGVLGGFTTFSSFAFDAFRLLDAKRYNICLYYCLCMIIFSFIAVVLGYTL
ncbi:fluoride efflux transporter FluC [Kurthia sibirica]|uniref:Fluoride-specific ion channel FluC n=1 Tax=Kurthia sibirica TaxID=202750 RepID=A0A2U3AK98_9BACL|nr:CrcB family protein [Kurthia sibirica]PWI24924.1 fluoride efflux transporter CrcB [Kurthia sibirica]GEK33166.1 putative fluoride ion transporter CrcB 2 [Kurthia sibirica]